MALHIKYLVILLLLCLAFVPARAQTSALRSFPDTVYITQGADTLTKTQLSELAAKMKDTLYTIISYAKNKQLKNYRICLRRTYLIKGQLEEYGIHNSVLFLSGIIGDPGMVVIRYSTVEERSGTECEPPPFPPHFYERTSQKKKKHH